MYRLISKILYTAAVILAALAAFFYLRFVGAKTNWTRSNANITEIETLPGDPSSQKITMRYAVNNESVTETITTAEFNSRKLHVGDTLVVMINPEDSSDRSLLESGPYMIRLSLRIAAWAVGIFATGFFVSRNQP